MNSLRETSSRNEQPAAHTEPLWFRIAWPILKWMFLGLSVAAVALDVMIVVRAVSRV